MAVKITSTKKSVNGVKVLVYGQAGTGKTRLCATVPNPIILSAEAGLLSLADEEIPVIEIKTVEDVMEAYQFLTEDPEGLKYETICLDSVSEIAEVLLSALKKKNSDARQAYGQLGEDMTHLIRSFRDIPNRHVYFTAKEVAIENDVGITINRPSMPGKTLLNALPFFFDELFCLRIGKLENGDEYTYLQTKAQISHPAKDRSGCLAEIEKPDLGNVFRKIKSGRVKKPTSPEKIVKADQAKTV